MSTERRTHVINEMNSQDEWRYYWIIVSMTGCTIQLIVGGVGQLLCYYMYHSTMNIGNSFEL